jgi:arylsulfatase A-like enzyme
MSAERSRLGWSRLLSRAAAGALAAFAAGLVLCAVDAAAALVAAHEPLRLAAVASLAGRSAAFLLPACMLAALLLAAVLWAAAPWHRAHRWLLRLLPLAWVAALFAYGVTWRAATGANLGFGFVLALAAVVLLVGALSYAALEAAVGRMISARTMKPIAAAVIAAVVLWAGLLAWTLRPERKEELPAALPPAAATRPNVLLIILDTVRPDHMSCYGYGRKTTPHIDAFAARSRVYRNTMSPGGWTLPSHASLFTGLPVSAHGCTWAHPYLDLKFDTLAEKLQAAGYQTVGLSSNSILSPGRLFAQGFQVYWTLPIAVRPDPARYTLVRRLAQELCPETPAAESEKMHQQLAAWFRKGYEPDRPFFIFLNYIEAHVPYDPPSARLTWASKATAAKWRKRNQTALVHRYKFAPGAIPPGDMRELEALYDEEIAYVDGKVGELLEWLRRTGLLDNTLVMITADHGEQFGEHGLMEHQYSLYEPVLRVPLIIRFRDLFPPGTDDTSVQTHDVFATALDVAGVAWSRTAAHNCRSLVHSEGTAGRVGIAEYLAPWLSGLDPGTGVPAIDTSRLLQPLRAIRQGDMKLIRWSGGAAELYDLAKDPRETQDLARSRPAEAERLGRMLDNWLPSFDHYKPGPAPHGPPRGPSKEELEALKELGYVR